ncbi:MAG TPA: SDR family NAD(P)-dependent oxidoreductase [Chloroflexota bacterium]|nr:SDR family NAD(P)-dependent oxidoreductase [Chloroflexota bacterium]HUM71306.1 SDR family NAD(P)-dependent oxidoreductase [Chloroflexota bacterium]
MSSPLPHKVILLTGASAGIGRATAVALAQSGANVVLVARRQERLAALVAELAVYPGQRLAIAGDVGEEAFAATAVSQTITTFGRLDVLINNAGLGHRSHLADMPTADMHRLWDTNVMGMMYFTQAAIPHMKQQGGGHIINISSIISQRPLPNMGLYCASKTAMNFISRTFRMELRPYHIHVSTVYPGRTVTEFGDALLGQPGANPSRVARVSAERVAQAIVKAINTGKTEVYITWTDWLFAHLNRLFPRATDWLVERIARSK